MIIILTNKLKKCNLLCTIHTMKNIYKKRIIMNTFSEQGNGSLESKVWFSGEMTLVHLK